MPKHVWQQLGCLLWVLMASGLHVEAQVLREPEMMANNRCT